MFTVNIANAQPDARMQKLQTALATSTSYKVRATAAVAMGRLGDNNASDALATSLRRDNHYAVRAAAASALGRLASDTSILPLLDALDDADPLVAREAERALQHLQVASMQGAFAQYRSIERPLQRRAVIDALGAIARQKGAKPEPHLLAALSDEDAAVAQSARTALDRLSHDRAVPLLIRGLSDEREVARAAAARMLIRRADEAATKPLIDALNRPGETPAVRRDVCAGLRAHSGFIDAAKWRTDLSDKSDVPTRMQAVSVLFCLDEKGDRERLGKLLSKDKAPRIRASVAEAMLESGNAAYRAQVEAALKTERDTRVGQRLRSLLRATK